MDLSKIVEAVVSKMNETQKPASDVVDDILERFWPQLTLHKGGVLWELARAGLIYLSNAKQHTMRGMILVRHTGNEDAVKILVNEVKSAPARIRLILKDIAYVGADGAFKPIWEFTVRDCQFAASMAKEKELGYKRVREFFEFTESLLRKHEVEMVKELPVVAQQGLIKKLKVLSL